MWWVTPLAQVANFLLLIWLLNRFLYGPIVRVMDQRQQRVTAGLRDAEEREKAAAESQTEFERKSTELDTSTADILRHAREDAEAAAQRIHETARAEAEEARVRWQESLQREQAEVLATIRRRLATDAGRIASAALRDLADEDLQRKTVHLLADKIAELPVHEACVLGDEAREEGSLVVRSGVEPDEEMREVLRKALGAKLGELPTVKWVHDDTLGFGVRLETTGREIGWSTADYVEGVTEQLMGALDRRLETVE